MGEDVQMNDEYCTRCFVSGHTKDECVESMDNLLMVESIAAFIGARLNYVVPECNSRACGGRPVSTIKVSQHKEKFFFVRVYCTLADDELVSQKWLDEREREADGESPTKQFRDECLCHDARHYRKCHVDMVRLVPSMKDRIVSGADYRELLFDDVKALFAFIDDEPRQGIVECLLERYDVATKDELKSKLKKFYA